MKDRWDALPECHRCRSLMKKITSEMAGFRVRGWRCPKCNEEIYLGDDLNKVLVYNKLKKGIPVKVGSLGSSLVMRLPKEVSNALDIKKGQEVTLKVRGKEVVVEV